MTPQSSTPAEGPEIVKPAREIRRELPEIGLRGVGLHAISEIECVEFVMEELASRRGGWIVTPNLDHLRRALKDPDFGALYEDADVRVADGMALVWACRLQRTPVPERVAGSNLIWSLSRAAGRHGRSIYLLGGNPGTDEAAAATLLEACPGLRVAGKECPPPGFERDEAELERMARRLEDARPDIVFVALGSPKQELLIKRLRAQLPRTWWVGVGISFSFVCGDVSRAPLWMQGIGMEWLHRVLQEPRRLFKRYFLQGLPFAAGLLTRCIVRGMLPKGRRASRYGPKKPSGLLIDDDPFALDHLELLLSARFPEVEFVKRQEPDVSGEFDFFFLDNDFDGEALAGRLAHEIRREQPEALIFAFSANLDTPTLKRLINAGCDGVCEKQHPERWDETMNVLAEHLQAMALRHSSETGSFGGVRHAATSIHGLLQEWNETGQEERRKSA